MYHPGWDSPRGNAGTVTFKRNGRVKNSAVVNGQTIKSAGGYQFVAGDIIIGDFSGGGFTGFVDIRGNTLTFNLLVRAPDGSIIPERTTATLVQKL